MVEVPESALKLIWARVRSGDGGMRGWAMGVGSGRVGLSGPARRQLVRRNVSCICGQVHTSRHNYSLGGWGLWPRAITAAAVLELIFL